MIQVNQLYITADNKHLIIDASIVESGIFKNIVFDKIAIDTSDTYVKDSISELAYTITHDVSNKKHVYLDIPLDKKFTSAKDGTATEYIVLPKDDMLFIHFLAKGEITLPEGETDLPCTWDNYYLLEVVCNMNSVYKKALNYINEMSQSCETPSGFIDFILNYNMLKSCLNIGAYNLAVQWWKKFKSVKIGIPISNYNKPCRCHG